MNRLVTIALFAYNSEKFISEAIESVLSQDYTPLEIILSDDASTDASYRIIEKYASEYVGPHKIIARRSDKNLGVAEHINKVWSLVSGEWLVVAAGDDISNLDRVSKIMEYVDKNPNTQLITSYAKLIDQTGRAVGIEYMADRLDYLPASDSYSWNLDDRINNQAPLPHGATLAYSRALIDYFPPLPINCIYEDNIIGFRGELLGSCCLIRLPLICYRSHSEQITKFGPGDIREKDIKRKKLNGDGMVTVKQNIEDLKYTATLNSDPEKYARVDKWLRLKLVYFTRLKQSLDYVWPFRLLPFALVIFSSRHQFTFVSKDMMARILLPSGLYFFLKSFQK